MLFCVSCTTRIRCFHSNQSINKRRKRIRVVQLTQNSIRSLRPADILENGATVTRRRIDELLNKVIIFIFFAYKKCSRHFITFRLNHWWQMDYSDDAFHTFLGLGSVNCLAVNGTVTNLPVFIQNILNCVLKTNKAFTGLERHGGKWLMTKCLILGWSNPLTAQ